MPSLVVVAVKREGVSLLSGFPEIEARENEVYLCHCRLNGRLKKGRYQLEVECQDWIKPGFFTTGQIVTKQTATAAVDLIVK